MNLCECPSCTLLNLEFEISFDRSSHDFATKSFTGGENWFSRWPWRVIPPRRDTPLFVQIVGGAGGGFHLEYTRYKQKAEIRGTYFRTAVHYNWEAQEIGTRFHASLERGYNTFERRLKLLSQKSFRLFERLNLRLHTRHPIRTALNFGPILMQVAHCHHLCALWNWTQIFSSVLTVWIGGQVDGHCLKPCCILPSNSAISSILQLDIN